MILNALFARPNIMSRKAELVPSVWDRHHEDVLTNSSSTVLPSFEVRSEAS